MSWFDENAPTESFLPGDAVTPQASGGGSAPSGPQDFRGWFEAATQGKPPGIETLLAMQADIEAHGGKLIPNATMGPDGKPTNYDVYFPGEGIVDVLQNATNSGQKNWQHLSGNGGGASGGYGSLLDPYGREFQRRSPEEIANDPAFKFQLEQGGKAIQGSAAARGTLLTGGTMKELASFGQGLASTFDDKYYGRDMGEYLLGRENFYNNQDRPYSKLMGVSNAGQSAANSTGAYGSSYGANASDLITGGGNARAAGSIAQGNLWSNWLSGLSSRYPSYGATR